MSDILPFSKCPFCTSQSVALTLSGEIHVCLSYVTSMTSAMHDFKIVPFVNRLTSSKLVLVAAVILTYVLFYCMISN